MIVATWKPRIADNLHSAASGLLPARWCGLLSHAPFHLPDSSDRSDPTDPSDLPSPALGRPIRKVVLAHTSLILPVSSSYIIPCSICLASPASTCVLLRPVRSIPLRPLHPPPSNPSAPSDPSDFLFPALGHEAVLYRNSPLNALSRTRAARRRVRRPVWLQNAFRESTFACKSSR